MDRLPEHVRLSTLVADPNTGIADMREVAVLLAPFHRDADRSERISAAANPYALRRRWEDLFTQPLVDAAQDRWRAVNAPHLVASSAPLQDLGEQLLEAKKKAPHSVAQPGALKKVADAVLS